MVTVFCGGRWDVARVIVTKVVGFARWSMALDLGWVFWESPYSIEPDSFGIILFNQKYSVQNWLISKVSNPGHGHLCFKDKTGENISFKTAEGNNGRGN